MDDSATRRVLIAGGGIAGLAVRRALHQRGIPSLTLERRGEQADAGLAINLPGNAVRALSQFGLLDLLRAVGAPVRRREYRTERGRLLFAVDETAFWGTEAGPHCLRRADLLRLLQDDLAPDDIRRGIAIATVRQDPQGVTAELADGSTEKGGLLVGADGVHSAVRRSLFGEQAHSVQASTPGLGVMKRQLWLASIAAPRVCSPNRLRRTAE